MVGTPKNSGKASALRAARIADILEKRCLYWSLDDIAAHHGISRTRVHQIIVKAIDDTVREPAEKLREMEAKRLDRIAKALAPGAEAGDFGAIDRLLSVMARRARLLGLDRQTGSGFNHPLTLDNATGQIVGGVTEVDNGAYTDEHGVQVIRVEVIGNPETTRRHPPPPESDIGDAPLPSTDDL